MWFEIPTADRWTQPELIRVSRELSISLSGRENIDQLCALIQENDLHTQRR